MTALKVYLQNLVFVFTLAFALNSNASTDLPLQQSTVSHDDIQLTSNSIKIVDELSMHQHSTTKSDTVNASLSEQNVQDPDTQDSNVRLTISSNTTTSSLIKPNQNILGITYNNDTALKAIERNVNLFTNRIRERFSVWLERSAKYIDIMKDILREKNLPEELVFLPFVESGFNIHAYSRARAVGPWQFISSTGKRYGLVIDWWRDERKDPVKSTKAAAEYLSDLYGMFGSWKLALAAYNAGEGKIMRALKTTGYDNYWSLLHTRSIKPETKEYVPRYIAAAMIANTPENYGFLDLQYHQPIAFDEVQVYSPVDIDVIAKCAETTVAEIRALNPELRRWSTPLNAPEYTVRIPQGTKETFLKNLSEISQEERFSIQRYIVRKGDTLKGVAAKNSVPVSVIIAMNSLNPKVDRLNVGDVIYIPPKGKYIADIDDKISAKKAAFKTSHVKGSKNTKPQKQTVKNNKNSTKSKKKSYNSKKT